MSTSYFGWLGRQFVWAILAASVVAMIAGFGGRLSPDFDLLANARGHLLGIILFAGLALWLNYRPVVVLALGSFLTFATHALLAQQNEGPLFGSAHAATGHGAETWTVLSLDTWHHHEDAAELADYLAQSNADLLVLTEFGPNKIAMLHQLEQVYPYRKDCAADWQCSIAILSRHPFTASGSAPQGAGPAAAWITFGSGEQAVTVIGVELSSPVQSSVVHARQLAGLAAFVGTFKGRVLLAGNLGATPWTNGYARFVSSSGLSPMGRFLPTYPSGKAGLPQLAIDHMFASPGLRFEDVWIGPDVGSTHRPLLADIAMPAGVGAAGR